MRDIKSLNTCTRCKKIQVLKFIKIDDCLKRGFNAPMQMIDRSYGDRLIQATFKIEEKEDDLRLDQFVKLFLKSHGRNEVKRKIQNKECFVTNRVSANKASSRLKIGDEVKIMIHQSTHEDEYWRGELLDLLTPTVSLKMMI